jgi:hypothetical protein
MTNTYQAITVPPFVRTFAITLTIVSASLVAQTAPYDSAKPLPNATLFAPGIISTGDYESHPTFTPDGHEIYFLKMAPKFLAVDHLRFALQGRQLVAAGGRALLRPISGRRSLHHR